MARRRTVEPPSSTRCGWSSTVILGPVSVSSITSSWQDLLVRRLRRPRRELRLWAVGFLLVAAAAIAATLLSQSDPPGYPRTLDLRLTWLTVADSGCPGVFPPSTAPVCGINPVA